MDAQELKEQLNVEDIINIVVNGLGSNGNEWDANGNPIFQTICHNPPGHGKYKLYYYQDTKTFVCYTECNIHTDIYGLVQKVKNFSTFMEAFYYVADFVGVNVNAHIIEKNSNELIDDWDLLNKYEDLINVSVAEEESITILNNNILEYFAPCLPFYWYQEGIGCAEMKKYGVRLDSAMSKIIIPHYDINGKLIGIRGRTYNPIELDEGKKYSPVYIENTMYNHALGNHLYGLNFTKEAIIRTKKVVIFEGEKSVLKAETLYGDNNFCVAACGSSISDSQVNLLLSLGVTEIIIAFDKENDNYIGSEMSVRYINKLENLASKFSPYVNTYIIIDIYDKLKYKDSPIDKGKEVLEFLLENKKLVPSLKGEKEKYERKTNKI